MRTLHIDLRLKGEERVELRYFFDNYNQHKSRNLETAAIADLIKMAEQDYYTNLPEDFDITGRRLYECLDENLVKLNKQSITINRLSTIVHKKTKHKKLLLFITLLVSTLSKEKYNRRADFISNLWSYVKALGMYKAKP
ncbi:hypothetical protein WA1_25215 [Scytonema hofmannii PCC 7110]|uniref:Uncharacterized protein n=1 Tax=Scytonema hofmannii PCC 7110 TaxID=128403 RepID=A0A139X8A2_9CYAN|nr:hypothetical protein WA1_25215 [Scytonema hofmannii PCC 7110]